MSNPKADLDKRVRILGNIMMKQQSLDNNGMEEKTKLDRLKQLEGVQLHIIGKLMEQCHVAHIKLVDRHLCLEVGGSKDIPKDGKDFVELFNAFVQKIRRNPKYGVSDMATDFDKYKEDRTINKPTIVFKVKKLGSDIKFATWADLQQEFKSKCPDV